MKAKVILTSVAAAGLFAACSQDDLAVVEANAPAEVAAGRVVAGKAIINVNEDGTRFNREEGKFETALQSATGKADKIGLYLMDSFVGENTGYEPTGTDANHLDKENWWKFQSNWQNGMYKPVNNIHTNYLYTYTSNGFVNENAALVEGNYFLFFDPECNTNDKAYRNRRELWKPIKSTIVLNNYTDTKYNVNKFGGLWGNLDNQFYLDYQQVYRNDDATDEDGNLLIQAKLKPVLAQVKLDVINQSAHKYNVKEIRLYPKPGVSVPNIAYVRPKSNKIYNIIAPTIKDDLYPGGKNTFTAEMARQLVDFEKIADTGNIPYGYEGETETAPYYSIQFADSAILDVHAGAIDMKSGLEALFAAPLWKQFKKSHFVIYADQYDPFVTNDKGTLGAWVPGYFEVGSSNDSWYVEDCLNEVNTGRLYFDDHAFTKYSSVNGIETSGDMYDRIQAVLAKNYVSDIQVKVEADGVKITKKINELIEKYEGIYGKDIKVTVIPNGHDVTIADENLINDNFDYSNFSSDNLIIAADQKLEVDAASIEFAVLEGTTVNIDLNGHEFNQVVNEGTINVLGTGLFDCKNYGTVTIDKDADVSTYDLVNNNDAVINVYGKLHDVIGAGVWSFRNDGTVNVGDKAEVTINKGEGILNVSDVTVKGGTQNHIEVVDPTDMTVVYETSEAKLEEIEKALKAILPAHFFTDPVKAITVTTTATAIEKPMTAAFAAMIDLEFANAITVSDNLDISDLKSVKFNGLTVKTGKTLKTTKANIKSNVIVEASATISDKDAINLDDATVNLYENAKLQATAVNGKGTIYGYDTQIVDASDAKLTPGTDITVIGHI